MSRARDVPRGPNEYRVPFRFDPTTRRGRVAVDVATAVFRCRSRRVPVSDELRTRWYEAATAAAYEDRTRKCARPQQSYDVGEIQRFERVVAGCMRLAAARLASENSSA